MTDSGLLVSLRLQIFRICEKIRMYEKGVNTQVEKEFDHSHTTSFPGVFSVKEMAGGKTTPRPPPKRRKALGTRMHIHTDMTPAVISIHPKSRNTPACDVKVLCMNVLLELLPFGRTDIDTAQDTKMRN